MDLSSLKNMAGDLANKVAEKIKNDPALLKKFKDDPVATLKGMADIDLPDEGLKALATAVEAKLGTGKAGSAADIIGKLF